MAIDYIIDLDCTPKQELTTNGILERLKGQQRADLVIRMFRDNGDDRPPSQMGFEFTRSTPEGAEETRVIIVQDLLDAAAELEPLRHHCAGCPANRAASPFGCIGFVQYPITVEGERWLIDRLPVPDEPLVWLLLRQGVEAFQYDGQTVSALRSQDSNYFEGEQPLARRLGEFDISSDQVFEMIFSVGNIIPNHAALLLLFFHAIDRELEADQIMHITPAGPDADALHPFRLDPDADADRTIVDLKRFLHALYIAWRLGVHLIVDA